MPAKSGYIYLSVYYPAPSFSAAPYGSHPNPITYSQRVLFDGDPLTCINLRSASCHVPVFRIMIPWFTGRDSYPTTFSSSDSQSICPWTQIGLVTIIIQVISIVMLSFGECYCDCHSDDTKLNYRVLVTKKTAVQPIFQLKRFPKH